MNCPHLFKRATLALITCLSGWLITEATDYEILNSEKYRLIVMADMGNEEDEMQQMMHLLLYANEIDIEGLVAVSGKFLHDKHPKSDYKRQIHPELFFELIEGYAEVLPNLKKHASGWSTVEHLESVVKSGTATYGIAAVGDGKSTEGSQHILEVLLKDDPRPVYIVGNAGTNTLAQALWDYRSNHTPEEVEALVSKIIFYENGSQDNSGAWIVSQFPSIHWIRSNYQTYCYMGFARVERGPYCWEPYPETNQGQHEWTAEHVQNNHGALGERYPDRFEGRGFLEGGGTTPWLGLITRGLYYPKEPQWGGWSGRYTAEKVKNEYSRHNDIKPDELEYGDFYVFADAEDQWMDPVTGTVYNSIATPIQRWRRDILENMKGRMDWCVESFQEANHNPVAVIDGISKKCILVRAVRAGESVALDASESFDPDDGQVVQFKWWIYPEAGTYEGFIDLGKATSNQLMLQIPEDAAGTQIHLILEVSDESPIANMKDYKRVVFNVE